MSGTGRAAEAAVVQLHEAFPLYPDNVFEGSDDRDAEPVEHVRELHDLCSQSSGGMYAFQETQVLCEKAGLEVPTTVLEAEKIIAEGQLAKAESSILSSALTAASDAFKVDSEALFSEINKLKDGLASGRNNGSCVKLWKLRWMYDADVSASNEKLQKCEKRADVLQARADLQSNGHKKEKEGWEKAIAILRAGTTKFHSKEDSECLKLP